MLNFFDLTIITINQFSCLKNVENPEKRNDATGNDDQVNINSSFISTNIVNIPDSYRNMETIVELSYTPSADLQGVASCSVSMLESLSVTTLCSCSNGSCSVGVTSTLGHSGPVSFDYNVTIGNTTSASNTVSFSFMPIGASPNDLWVRVPANAGDSNLREFYVMKYEAKAWRDFNNNSEIDDVEVSSDGDLGQSLTVSETLPVSLAQNQPWRMITPNQSYDRCNALGTNYALISNNEWMAIAKNIEMQGANWTGSSVGSGCLFTGNSSDTTCGYQAAISPDSGLVRSSRAKHVLSNGQEIYDLSGNSLEFVDWDEQALGFTSHSGCTTNVHSTNILHQSLFDDHSDCMDNDSYRPKSSYPSS